MYAAIQNSNTIWLGKYFLDFICVKTLKFYESY